MRRRTDLNFSLLVPILRATHFIDCLSLAGTKTLYWIRRCRFDRFETYGQQRN